MLFRSVQQNLAKRTHPQEKPLFAICQVSMNIYRLHQLYLDCDISSDELDSCIAMAVDHDLEMHILLKPAGERFERVGLTLPLDWEPVDFDEFCYENGQPLMREDWENLEYYTVLYEWVNNSTPQTVFVE